MGCLLFVFVGVDARSDFEFAAVEMRQASVGRKTGYAVVHRVPFPVGMAARKQSLDEVDHLRNIVRRRRDDVRSLDAELRAVCEKRLGIGCRILPDIDPLSVALRMILSSISVMFMTWTSFHLLFK